MAELVFVHGAEAVLSSVAVSLAFVEIRSESLVEISAGAVYTVGSTEIARCKTCDNLRQNSSRKKANLAKFPRNFKHAKEISLGRNSLGYC